MKPASLAARAALAGAVLAAATTVCAAAPTKTPLRIEHAWIRWLPANLPEAGYAVIVNNGNTTARLISAASPDYATVTLHRSFLKQDSSRMEAVSGMDVPAHGQAALAPGGYHLMLMNPTRSLKPGDTVKITLRFAGGESLQVDFPVRPANASGPRV